MGLNRINFLSSEHMTNLHNIVLTNIFRISGTISPSSYKVFTKNYRSEYDTNTAYELQCLTSIHNVGRTFRKVDVRRDL